jgi:hypothetical protein
MADTPQNHGYSLALEAARKISGKEHGSASWLAEQLGISRQRLFNYRDTGFPNEMVPQVSKITGVPAKKLRKHLAEIPEEVWDQLCVRNPKSLMNQIVLRK